MSRRLAVALVLAIVVLVAVLVVGGEDDRAIVEAQFDTARSLVPGQQVKIAGARVGSIDEVALTDDQRKVRIRMRIDRRFAPFHDDASCEILPEGFVSESFVQCDPGTPGRPDLASIGGVPTVPLARTRVPVQLQDVIDVFSLPVSQRLRVLLTELGTSVTGRGEDLNALLRRANPALQQAQQLLAIVRSQRRQIATATRDTDAVLATLAHRDGSLRRFVGSAADVAETTSRHRAGLATTVRNLPALLREARHALGSVDEISDALTPTARRLRAAAPGLRRLNSSAPAFAKLEVPALRRLAGAVQATRGAIGPSRPVVRSLAEMAGGAGPSLALTREFAENLRDRGGFEHLGNMLYGLAVASGGFDAVSHVAGITLAVAPECFLDPSIPQCNHNFNGPGGGRIPINAPHLGPIPPTHPLKQPGGRVSSPLEPIGAAAARATVPRTTRRTATTTEQLPERTRRELLTVLDRLLR